MTSGVDVVTAGEVMMSLHSPPHLAPGVTLTASIAGAEANVAIGLARLGHHVAWAGRVGDDDAGALVQRTLQAEQIDAHCVVDGAPTGIMVRRERLPGVITVNYHRRMSAGASLNVGDIETLIQGPHPPRWVHLTGITPALSDTARQAVHDAMTMAQSQGISVSFDVNYRSRLWTQSAAATVLRPLARLADVVVASDDELPLVAQTPEELLSSGVRLVAIKRGADGASLHCDDGSTVDRAAVPVREVDPVGAGDAFCAGLLSGLLDRLDLPQCLDRAVLMGAFAVTTSGDWEGLPTRSELNLLSTTTADVRR